MADKPGDKDPKRGKKSTMFGIAPPALPGEGGAPRKSRTGGTLQGMPSVPPDNDEPELIIEAGADAERLSLEPPSDEPELILSDDGDVLDDAELIESLPPAGGPPPPLPGGKGVRRPVAPAPLAKKAVPKYPKFQAAKEEMGPATVEKPGSSAKLPAVGGLVEEGGQPPPSLPPMKAPPPKKPESRTKLPAMGLRTIPPGKGGRAGGERKASENELLKPRPLPTGFLTGGKAPANAPPGAPSAPPLLDLDLSPLDRPTGPPVLALEPAEVQEAPSNEPKDAWDAVSSEPRRGLSIPATLPRTTPPPSPSASEHPAARELVARSRPPSGRVDLAHEMRDRFALDDFSGALRAAELVLGREPGNKEAENVARASRERLAQIYISRIGSLTSVPEVMVPDAEVRWLGLDHRAGFLLSRIDGVTTVDELVDVSGMGRLEALKILAELLEAKAIRFTR